MEVEILWNNNPTQNFIEDLKSFANSLDHYQIVWDLTKTDQEKFVYLKDGNYEVLFEQKSNAFKCPNCEACAFSVMEGELNGNPALGLICASCESYGAVFLNGL